MKGNEWPEKERNRTHRRLHARNAPELCTTGDVNKDWMAVVAKRLHNAAASLRPPRPVRFACVAHLSRGVTHSVANHRVSFLLTATMPDPFDFFQQPFLCLLSSPAHRTHLLISATSTIPPQLSSLPHASSPVSNHHYAFRAPQLTTRIFSHQ